MASRILVTGGSGLLGSYLKSNDEISYVLAPKTINFLEKNSCDILLKFAQAEKCEKVLHLAWCSNSRYGYEKDKINYVWAKKTIEFAKKTSELNLFFISIGSGSEDDHENVSPYAESKRLVRNELIKSINNSNLAIIKVFYIVDISMKRPSIVRSLIESNRNSDFSVKYSSTAHDYIMRQDVISGLKNIVGKNLTGQIELGSGFLTSNINLIKYVCSQINYPLPKFENLYMNDTKPADLSRILETGWSPYFTKEAFSTL